MTPGQHLEEYRRSAAPTFEEGLAHRREADVAATSMSSKPITAAAHFDYRLPEVFAGSHATTPASPWPMRPPRRRRPGRRRLPFFCCGRCSVSCRTEPSVSFARKARACASGSKASRSPEPTPSTGLDGVRGGRDAGRHAYVNHACMHAPNGIRTRATALKGPRPGPLVDGGVRNGQASVPEGYSG